MADNGVSPAVSNNNPLIPIIDFSAFLHGTPTDSTTTARAILSGFQTAGFIYLRNHGISRTTITTAFSESARFFRRPQAQKDALAWYSPRANRGYVAHGREKLSQLADRDAVAALRGAMPDLKESLEIGRDDEAGAPNMLPDRFDGEGTAFKRCMMALFDQCCGLHVQVMRAIALGLGLSAAFFDGFTDGRDNTLRLLHYPPVAAEALAGPGTVRAGEHTDYGSVTFLFQDAHGGLQVQGPGGGFVDATPIPDTIVVNAGDLLARWSNDSIKSTKHRVVQPPVPHGMYPARYSIACFCNPNYDKFIDVIPGTWEEGEGKKYEGVYSGEYLVRRLEATY